MRKNVIKGIILGTIVLFASPINALAADMYSIGNVNIRSAPDGEVIGILGYNAGCNLLDTSDPYGWYQIESGGITGYIASQYLSDAPLAAGYTIAKVNAEVLYVRQWQSVDANILATLEYGDEIEITSDYDGSAWVEVVTEDGLYGYVNADFVTLYTYYPTAQMIYPVQEENSYSYEEFSDLDCYTYGGKEEQSWNEYYENTHETDYYTNYEYEEPAYDYSQENQYYDSTDEEYYEYDNDEDTYDEEYYDADEGTDVTSTNSYSGVAGTANQYLGNSYVWGGSSPGGFDCSGLAQYSYSQNGISIPRTAADQYYGGTKISVEEAINTPGALIFYHDLGHVGISNGDGTITHASNYDTGVIVSDAYYSTPYGAVIY